MGLSESAKAQIEAFRAHLAAKPSKRAERMPRRLNRQRWTDSERAIQAAVDAVESLGADVRLTDAVVLLQQAKAKVADFVDAQLPNV